MTVYRGQSGVAHLQYAVDPARPWLGRPPWASASLSGTLLAGIERQLAGEAGSASGYILPTPDVGDRGQEGADADELEDPLTTLRRDLAAAGGKTMLAPTSASLPAVPWPNLTYPGAGRDSTIRKSELSARFLDPNRPDPFGGNQHGDGALDLYNSDLDTTECLEMGEPGWNASTGTLRVDCGHGRREQPVHRHRQPRGNGRRNAGAIPRGWRGGQLSPDRWEHHSPPSSRPVDSTKRVRLVRARECDAGVPVPAS